MKELGIITKTDGEYAYVILTKGLCGDGCAACTASCKKTVQLKVRNKANAAVGETVTVSRSIGKSAFLAVLSYVLPPVIFFISSYFIKSDWLAVALLFISFVLCSLAAGLLKNTKCFIGITGRLGYADN